MINNFNIANKKVIIYGFGITGKWLSSNIKCDYFVDTDIKKCGNTFNNISVKRPDFLKQIKIDEYIIIITTVDIFDVIPLVNRYSANWISLSDVITIDSYDLGINITDESDEFLKYSIDTVLQCQTASFLKDSFYLRSVDLVITEKCTLKCKDCANLMQFYENPVNYEFEDILSGIKLLSAKTNFIHEVRVIGGEPFLNKQIYKIIYELSLIDNINKIIVYTNGMIPPKEEELNNINRNKLLFSITDYAELGRNLDKTIEILNNTNFAYRVHPPEHWTDSGKILERNNDVDFAEELFAKCCGKNLYTLIGNKLYRCPFAANADQLNALPPNTNNFVSVDDSIENIRSFAYGINYIEACMYCPGRSFDSPVIIPAIQAKKSIFYKKFIPVTLTHN